MHLPRRALLALLCMFFSVNLGLMVLMPCTILLMAERRMAPLLIGAYSALFWAGVFAGAALATPAEEKLGRKRLYLSIVLGHFVVLLMYGSTDYFGTWLLAGLLLGVLSGARYSIGSAWGVEAPPPRFRGRFVAAAESSWGAASFIGPYFLSRIGVEGSLPFWISAGFFAVAGLSLWAFVPDRRPPHHGPNIRSSWRTLGVGFTVFLWGSLIGGVFESGPAALLPVHGINLGLTVQQAALIVTAIGLGNFLLQFPIGMLADRFAASRLVIGSLLALVVGAVLLAAAPWFPAILLAVGFLWGAAGGGLYTLAVIYAGTHYRGPALVAATSALVSCYTIGGILGPGAGGVGMEWLPTHGLALVFGGLAALTLIVTWVSKRTR